MNWQTVLYFSSIVLTFILTGFLAWYAWKHDQVPASRAYMRLTLSECFFALTEIFSVLSPSSTTALFWFQARYLAGAFIAVFWLVFALEYNGHREWLSKHLLAGMFVIPLVTQVLLWSNPLHGLWIKQEAGFTQNGIFWIADITSRIPGLGYLTHSFYTLLLTLAGIALMFLTAWKMRRELLGQAVMLAGAGLTAFLFAMNSLFNFLPKTGVNPFTPGIGLSVLLIALSVFRFEFLKRAPAQEDVLHVNRLDAQEKYSLAGFILTFILFTSGLAAVSYLTYHNYEKQFRAQVDGELSAIAELKMSGIVNWRSERMSDAEAMLENPVFAELAQKSLENPDDAQTEAKLQTWLDIIRNSYGYDRVFLLDTKGVERVSSPATLEPVADYLKQQVAAALKTGQVTFLDFHRDSPNGSIRLALLVPIYVEHDLNRPLGLLVLRIDPTTYLYPYINQWPTVSQTAETLLVRRDGSDILYLNELKFQQNAALNFRVPLEESQVLAVQAAQGVTGVVQGVDYRDAEVIGYVDAIPGSPWYLIARMDTAEVYAPLRARLWQTVVSFGMFILIIGAGLTLVWRQQRVRYYRAQYETTEALRKSEEQYRGLIEHASDGIFIADAGGKYLEVNPSGCAMLGYTRDEILSKRISDLVAPEDIAATPLRLDELRQGKTVLSERRLICKDGSMLAVEISGRMLPDGRFQSITRDITARKQAQESLRASEEKFRLAFETSPDSVAITRAKDGMFVSVNKGFEQITGHLREEVIGKTSLEINIWKDPEDRRKIVEGLKAGGEVRNYEAPFLTRDGEIVGLISAVIIELDGEPHILNIVRDITERKQAEDALRISEKDLRESQRIAHVGNWFLNVATNQVVWSEELYKMYGFDPALPPPPYTEHMKLFTPESWERLSAALTNTRETGFPYELELETVRKDGSSGWMWARGEAEIDPKGKIVGLWGAAQDITERKQAEEALHASEANLSALIENTDGSIWAVDRHYGLIVGNEEFHHNVSAALGRRLESGESVIPPNFPAEAISEWQGYYDRSLQGERFSIETLTRFRSDPHYIEYYFSPIRGDDGGIRGVTVYGRDITERKLAEEKLAASEVRYRRLFEAARDGILIMDAYTGIILDANPFLVEMLGFPLEEFVGKELWELGFFKDIAANKDNLLELQQKEYIRYEDLPLETANGQKFNVEFVSNVYQVNHHKVIQCNIRNITERKRAEEALLQVSERLALAQRLAGAGIWDWDLETGKLNWTPEFFSLFGLDPAKSDATFDTWRSALHPDDVQGAEQHITEAIRDHVPLFNEYRIVTPSGETRWIGAWGDTTYNERGEALRMTGLCIDTTDRKQAEAQLRESEERFHLMFEKHDATMLLIEPQTGLILDANQAAAKFYGYPKSTLCEMSINEINSLPPEQVAAELRKALREERNYFVFSHRLANGEERVVEVHSSPIFFQEKPALFSIIHDITERKRAEDALRESEEKYRSLVQSIQVGVVVHALDSSILFSNPRASQLLGLTPDQMRGKTAIDEAWRFIREDETRMPLEEYPVNRALASNIPITNLILGILRPDREEPNWVQCNTHQDRDLNGNLQQVVISFADITERKQAEEQLIKTLEELKRSNAELEQFAYVASHDLQEPLRAVAGMVQLLQQRYKDRLDERANEYIGLAVDGATRMQTLISDLLTYSRVDRRGNPIQTIDANAALKSVLRNLSAAITELGATVTNEELPMVEADATQLTQLFQNLIGNAIKFHGERPAQVHIGVEKLDDAWQFSVSDNGIGIEPQYFERIFLVFQRLHTRRDYPGTGIGLSICKKIVERHGGRIWIESQSGRGSTFYFTIPFRSKP